MGIISRSRTVAKSILPLIYFLIVSLPHHPFSYWLDYAFIKPVGFYSVQHIADIVTWAFLGVAAAVFVRVAIIHRWRAVRHFSILLVLVALMYPTDYYLIVNNIERIHYPQYAILALLLGLSLRNEMLIFLVTTFAGFVDEFLQYAMDPMKTNYLDFNDIVLNVLGAAAGVVLLMGLRKPLKYAGKGDLNRKDREETAKKEIGELGNSFKNSSRSCLPRKFLVRGRPWRLSSQSGTPELSRYEAVFGKVFRLSMAVGATVVLVARLFGRIVLLVEQKKDRSVFEIIEGKLSFVMSFERHDEFWIKSYFGKVFHVMGVGEGLLVISALCLGTWVAVRWLRQGGTNKPNPPQDS